MDEAVTEFPQPDAAQREAPPREGARPGVYVRGAETVELILEAARGVLIDEGASAFTLRRIAARCGMKVGNVSYYFARKELLVQLLLDDLLDYYERVLDETVRQPGLSPEAQLSMLIGIVLDDIGTKRTTHLFTELWALANHNVFIAERVAAFYRHAHGHIAAAVLPLNPALSPADADVVARFISAAMEGTTIFAGHGKPWAHQMPQLKSLAVAALVHLAKTIKPEDIRRLPAAGAPQGASTQFRQSGGP
ncbi:TetR/AcrR family transcriptional regulator [Sandarakinorhabdus rubra]|uniref:TetR/AcrR family transcriptional regulator n=1 Tax=Sandarakinorhabdus rubra TaxID=2672568 RepID=UPI0013DA1BCF|nr:TetR/AcrR family transcriptional regulator [Sandarakinorhabdus rubra]